MSKVAAVVDNCAAAFEDDRIVMPCGWIVERHHHTGFAIGCRFTTNKKGAPPHQLYDIFPTSRNRTFSVKAMHMRDCICINECAAEA